MASLLATAAPAAAPAETTTSQSSWYWGNPQPQGQGLTALTFTGISGYAAGDRGSVLHSFDGGRSWRGVASGMTTALRQAELIDGDSLVIADDCNVRRTDDGGRTFRTLPWTSSSATCRGGITALSFPNSTAGMLVLGNGVVRRTTDAGHHWQGATPLPRTPAAGATTNITVPSDAVFTSADAGFVTTSRGAILATSDGGKTWRTAFQRSLGMGSMAFPSAQVGYAVGDAPTVVKTADGGATFTELALPEGFGSARMISCASPDACAVLNLLGDQVASTADGGATWRTATVPARMRAIAMSAAGTVVVGAGGVTATSTDGGASFATVGGALTGQFRGLTAASSVEAFAYGRAGALARTQDAGRSWRPLSTGGADILAASFAGERVGTVLEQGGGVLRTGDGGDTFTRVGSAPAARDVLSAGPGHVLLAGTAGVVRSDDGGASFTQTGPRVSLAGIDRAGSQIVAWGEKAIVRSVDGGSHFRAVRRPSTRTRIERLDAVSSRSLFLLDVAGRLYRTTDGGRHWRELPALGTEAATAMAFSDTLHGWVAVPDFGGRGGGWVLRTDDGGRSWRPQLTAASPLQADGLAAPGARSGYVLSSASELLATRAAGNIGRRSELEVTARPRRVDGEPAVRVSGRLRHARGGEQAVVSLRPSGRVSWLYQPVTLDRYGRFAVNAPFDRGTTRIVVQWAGNDRLRGDGTGVLTVRR